MQMQFGVLNEAGWAGPSVISAAEAIRCIIH